MLAQDLAGLRIPMIGVLGNHDWESNKAPEITRIFTHAGIHLLDGDTFIFDKRLGFAGVKGFCGGFGDCTLQAWGEEPIKNFVFESVNQSLRLEMALAKLEVLNLTAKVAITHYAPIPETVVGEKPQNLPFLGCSRLAETLDKQGVLAAFHGHAHHGTLQGATPKGIPVYNVAMPLLKARLERRFIVVEVDAPPMGDRPWQPAIPAERNTPPVNPAAPTPHLIRRGSPRRPRTVAHLV